MNSDTYIANIRNDLLQARKQRNVVRSQTLLSVLNAIDNASAVDVPLDSDVTEVARKELSVKDVRQIIRSEANEIREALEIYKRVDNAEQVAELDVKLAVLNEYLAEE